MKEIGFASDVNDFCYSYFNKCNKHILKGSPCSIFLKRKPKKHPLPVL